jgi:hypothetical protein
MSDRASKALAEASLPGEPRTYDTRSKRSGVPLTTLYYRDHGRPSREEKAQGQQYLTPSEEKALEKYLKLMAKLGNPVQIKCLPSLAFSIPHRRAAMNKATKTPAKN